MMILVCFVFSSNTIQPQCGMCDMCDQSNRVICDNTAVQEEDLKMLYFTTNLRLCLLSP